MNNKIGAIYIIFIVSVIILFNNNNSNKRIEELEEDIKYLNQQIVDININRAEIEELRVELYEVADVRDWQTTEVHSRIDILENGFDNLQQQFEEVSLQRVFITDSE